MSILVAQVDQAAKALDAAAKEGWVAVSLVFLMIVIVGAFGFVARFILRSFDRQLNAALEREARLAIRITQLEDFIRDTLLGIVKESHDAFSGVMNAIQSLQKSLDNKPFLLNDGHRSELTEKVAGAVVAEMKSMK